MTGLSAAGKRNPPLEDWNQALIEGVWGGQSPISLLKAHRAWLCPPGPLLPLQLRPAPPGLFWMVPHLAGTDCSSKARCWRSRHRQVCAAAASRR